MVTCPFYRFHKLFTNLVKEPCNGKWINSSVAYYGKNLAVTAYFSCIWLSYYISNYSPVLIREISPERINRLNRRTETRQNRPLL